MDEEGQCTAEQRFVHTQHNFSQVRCIWPSSHLVKTILNFISRLQGNLSASISYFAQACFYELVPSHCMLKVLLSTLSSWVGFSFPHYLCKLFGKQQSMSEPVFYTKSNIYIYRRYNKTGVRLEQFLKYWIHILFFWIE